jgi:hypothetical protein
MDIYSATSSVSQTFSHIQMVPETTSPLSKRRVTGPGSGQPVMIQRISTGLTPGQSEHGGSRAPSRMSSNASVELNFPAAAATQDDIMDFLGGPVRRPPA